MTRNLTALSLLVSMLIFASDTFAFWGWMRGTVVSEFTEADWDILKEKARSTLDSAPDGEQVNWRNEDSGNKGAMKAIMTFQYQNQTCRRMAFLNVNRKGHRSVANYNLCEQPDGTWLFVADSTVTANQG